MVALLTIGLALTLSSAEGPNPHPDPDPDPAIEAPSPASELSYTHSFLDHGLHFHGFVSQGFIKSTDNNYLVRSKRGSVEFTEVALNLSLAPTDDFTVSMQLFTRDLGPIGNYDAAFDWFLLDWHRWDEFGIQVGRSRTPFGLYNDTSDYDPGRINVLLPQSLYPTTSRDFLLAATGVQVYGAFDLGRAGYLDYRAYAGTQFLDVRSSSETQEARVPYVAGGRLLWSPVQGLRLGGSVLSTKLEGDVSTIDVSLQAFLWVASVEYQRGIITIAAEYGRWRTDTSSSDPNVVPRSHTISERYYALVTTELLPWLHLSAYYAGQYNDIGSRSPSSAYQHDASAALRFDLNSYWLLKIEGHFMRGTGILSTSLNEDPATLSNDWGVLLVKTTAYF